MIVVSENLAGIVKRFGICESTLVEEFSIAIRLGQHVRRPREHVKTPLLYGMPYDHDQFFESEERLSDNLVLKPGDAVLACSRDRYVLPVGYFGLVQTKGSLARAFVSATCNDGQIEPGYSGRITLEMTNQGRFAVSIPLASQIAQMYVLRCTSEVAKPYAGRYQNADAPTVPSFEFVR